MECAEANREDTGGDDETQERSWSDAVVNRILHGAPILRAARVTRDNARGGDSDTEQHDKSRANEDEGLTRKHAR